MALFGSFASRFARPAGKVLDAPIREIVHEVLREHGYASPAELQALRDELRDLRTRVEGLDRKVNELAALAEEARAEAAAARAEAASNTRPAPADPRITELETRIAELDAALTAALEAARTERDARLLQVEASLHAIEAARAPTSPAAAAAAPGRGDCKVPECAEAVRSKGFCSAHYQQWRRGTLKGFVTAEATLLVGDRIVHLPADTVGSAVSVEGDKVIVGGRVVA